VGAGKALRRATIGAMRTLLTGLAFAEAPRWHDGALWFSDFYTRRVQRLDVTSGEVRTVCEVPGQPSGLGWLPDGRLLVVSMTDRRVLRLEPDGMLGVHADLTSLASFHCNDMVVDAGGRAYVGNFGYDLLARAPPASAELVLVQPDGRASVAARELMFPNGAVVTPDGRTLVVAETGAKRLTAFDIAEDGALAKRRLWADLGALRPDGICLDAEGAIWCAVLRARACVRVREGGEVADRIETEDTCIACALGAEDGRTLFVVTGEVMPASEALAARRGRIWAKRVDVGAATSGRP
jgi:sugar lactone lactonase YvrE